MKLRYFIFAAMAALLAFAAFKYIQSNGLFVYSKSESLGAPVVFRTEGGLLEVGGFEINEEFYRENYKIWFGLYLGKTVSQIKIPVTYKYHIILQNEWTVHVKDNICTVMAPKISPTLPVAFDSGKMQKKTENGWMRFDKIENLNDLERSITKELGARAWLPDHLVLVREAARKTVTEFVQSWLLRDSIYNWNDDSNHVVKVSFPGEKEEKMILPSVKIDNL